MRRLLCTGFGRVKQRPRAVAPTLGPGPPKGVSIDRLSGVGASVRGFVFSPGWAGGNGVWSQCWLCAVCAVSRVSCCVGGVSINQSKVLTKPHTCKEKPYPSTATEGSTPCVTKCRRLGELKWSRDST